MNAIASQRLTESENPSLLLRITKLAAKLGLSLEVLQQTAFRLIFVGLAEEVPLTAIAPVPESVSDNSGPDQQTQPARMSEGFLEKLSHFLSHTKVAAESKSNSR
ncbi:hypothetical protein IQ241_22520 [Romeria aff. gracilis LEGE 07310]|uniref:Uncharacterized protein n=1 Tax=Vasconcelosia minhoensis LEGE 07310 TaxID=915328 RepID=A0A8J7DPP1_9CYAN|nr:hypothetical protein [Romeria gracilis]MBE9080030.1 hypothetical protein [Romeria aff. gracilis LEGE 07310]